MTDTAGASIRVLIVDDDLYVRESLSDYLSIAPDIVLLGSCANGTEAVAKVRESPPDVILMDIQMPIMDGIQATRAINQVAPTVRVVALSSFGDDDAVAGMLAAGATGFLIKNTRPHVLIDAIRSAHNGLTIVPADTVRRWAPGRTGATGPALPDRERQVLQLLAAGLSNRQIGEAMFVSASTVKGHLSDLMRRLQVSNRIGVVARAHELDLLNHREEGT